MIGNDRMSFKVVEYFRSYGLDLRNVPLCELGIMGGRFKRRV